MALRSAARARWLVRIAILIVILLLVVGLWLATSSSGMSVARAMGHFQTVRHDMTLAEVEQLLGPFQWEEDDNGQKHHWIFQNGMWNEVRSVDLWVKVYRGKVVQKGMMMSVVGDVWQYRWNRLKQLLGV